jgi:arylsulfatase A-like enzyme
MIRQPLLIRVPGKKGTRLSACAQPADITPNILDYFGIKTPEHCHGESLLPVMAGKKKLSRTMSFSNEEGLAMIVSDKNWSYNCFVDRRRPCALFDLRHDPHQKHDVARKNLRTVRRMHAAMTAFLRRNGAKEELISRHDPMM